MKPRRKVLKTGLLLFTITEKGAAASSRRAMSYEEMEAWVKSKLEESKKKVEQGLYSEASLKLDEKEFNKALEDIKNGATVYLQEFEDGSHMLETYFPNAENQGGNGVPFGN